MTQNETTPSIKIDEKNSKESTLIRWLAYIAIVISIISLTLSISNLKVQFSLFDNKPVTENSTVHYTQFEKWDTCLNGFAFSTGNDGDLIPVYKYPFVDSKTPVQGIRVLCGQKKGNE